MHIEKWSPWRSPTYSTVPKKDQPFIDIIYTVHLDFVVFEDFPQTGCFVA